MDVNEYMIGVLRESRDSYERCLGDTRLHAAMSQSALVLITALSNGNKVLLAGNGGSAADCQHIAAELVGRFKMDRDGLPAIALTTDTSAITSIANDYGYDQVFARQVLALGKAGDVLMSFSTSGTSPSILNAMAAAKVANISNIAFTGSKDSPMLGLADVALQIPDDRTAYIQQAHIMIGHALCGIIETAMFS